MPAKIKTFEQFKKSLLSSKHVINKQLSDHSESELKKYFDKMNNLDTSIYGKKPLRYLYDFINFNVDDDWLNRIEKIISLGYSNCKEKSLLKYGDVEGSKRWESYLKIQAETNSFEYKNKKYNMTADEFNRYNQSRACTLSNFILRYGDIDGAKKWDEYVKRQSYTTTLEYFVETYGFEAGTEKYNNFIDKRPLFATDNQLAKTFIKSKMEIELFDAIKHLGVVADVRINDERYYAPFDMGVPEQFKLIEFYGDYWHMNPMFYHETYVHPVIGITAKHKWALDCNKRKIAKEKGYDTLVIWEHEWLTSKEAVILKVKDFLNEARDN